MTTIQKVMFGILSSLLFIPYATAQEVIDEESSEVKRYNYWDKSNRTRTYRLIRYSDGTSKYLDYDNNYIVFKTEYATNEYTGEVSTTPIKIDNYITPRNYPKILSAKHAYLNGYELIIDNLKMSMTSPIGVIYIRQLNELISSEIWYDEFISPGTNFFGSFDKFFGSNVQDVKIIANGRELKNVKNSIFKDVADNEIRGGYYDGNGLMYYTRDCYEHNPYNDDFPDGYVMQEIEVNGEKKYAYCGFNENGLVLVKNVSSNNNVVEINYADDSYLKISKLKNGELFDCMIKRKDGVWTVKLDNSQPVSDFVFADGPYKNLVYKPFPRNSAYGKCVSRIDLIPLMDITTAEYGNMYEPSKNRWVKVRGDGLVQEYLDEEEEARRRIDQGKAKLIYQAYCNKYGKSNVDNILKNRKLTVGMPFSMVKELCNCTLTDETTGSKWYKVWFSGYEYDLANKRIRPYGTAFSMLANQWFIRVSDGVVRYVGFR